MLRRNELHSDFEKGIFSSSAVTCCMTCPRLCYYKYILSLKPAGTNVHTHFGIAFHEGVGVFYKTRNKAEAIRAFTKTWAEKGMRGTEKKNLETGIIAIGKYCDVYKNDDTEFLPSMIEASFQIEMPNGTQMIGFIDRLSAKGNFNLVHDTKTTSSYLGDNYFKYFRNDFQQSTYWHACEQLVGECNGTLVDAVKIPALQDDCFERREIMRTKVQMNEWMKTYVEMTDKIIKLFNQHGDETIWLQNQTSCGDFGGCAYLPVCIYGKEHPALQVDFVVDKSEEAGE